MVFGFISTLLTCERQGSRAQGSAAGSSPKMWMLVMLLRSLYHVPRGIKHQWREDRPLIVKHLIAETMLLPSTPWKHTS